MLRIPIENNPRRCFRPEAKFFLPRRASKQLRQNHDLFLNLNEDTWGAPLKSLVVLDSLTTRQYTILPSTRQGSMLRRSDIQQENYRVIGNLNAASIWSFAVAGGIFQLLLRIPRQDMRVRTVQVVLLKNNVIQRGLKRRKILLRSPGKWSRLRGK